MTETQARRSYHQELDDIHGEIDPRCGSPRRDRAACHQILLNGDLPGADALIHGDDVFNERCIDLEHRCYALLGSPAAGGG